MSKISFPKDYGAWALSFAVVAIFAFIIFGFAGFRTIVAMALLFAIPPLLFLKNSSLDVDEKLFFSFFIGIGLFALLAWAVNQVLPSFRVSVVVAFAVVIAASLVVPVVLKAAAIKAKAS